MYKMMLGSLQAGLAFSNSSLGLVHAMAHSMGGLLDLPHGECNSILLEHVIDFNFDVVPRRYTDIAERMHIETKDLDQYQIKIELLEKIRAMRKYLGIKDFVEVEGLNGEILDKLAKEAIEDPCIVTNPKNVTNKEIREIFERVLCKKKS